MAVPPRDKNFSRAGAASATASRLHHARFDWCRKGSQKNPLEIAMISPDQTDGGAVPGDHLFAGAGWSGKFSQRPLNDFDLASKIHDTHYHCNDLTFFGVGPLFRELLLHGKKYDMYSILEYRRDNKDFPIFNSDALYRSLEENCRPNCNRRQTISRVAKSDYIFRIMNGHKSPKANSNKIIDTISRIIFVQDAKKFFLKEDGFRHFLTDKAISDAFSSAIYRMLPVDFRAKDKNKFPNDLDQPDFYPWFRDYYAGILPEIESLCT